MDRRTFILASGASLVAAAEQSLELRAGGRVAAELHAGGKWDKPFLYPIRTVSGKTLSRGWPVEQREGDSTDHAWHRGFWYGHGDINDADFWREQGHDKTARLLPKSRLAVKGGVGLDLAMTPPSGKPMGSMQQSFRLADQGDLRVVDASITIHADAGPLTFGDTSDGGFGFRLREEFREDRGARLRNAEGLTGAKNIWGKASKWVDYSASIDGAPAGVVVFDHPSNLRHPTRWHARGYGLNAANPFALREFLDDPAADGKYTLPAGKKLALRYRVVIYDGAPDIEALYREFAKA